MSPAPRANAELVEAAGFAIRVASPEDLIAMKRGAGSNKDLADIEELEAIIDVRKRS